MSLCETPPCSTIYRVGLTMGGHCPGGHSPNHLLSYSEGTILSYYACIYVGGMSSRTFRSNIYSDCLTLKYLNSGFGYCLFDCCCCRVAASVCCYSTPVPSLENCPVLHINVVKACNQASCSHPSSAIASILAKDSEPK